MTERQASEGENTEERSHEQTQPISIVVTDMSSQDIDNTGVSAANEGTAFNATVSNEASFSPNANEEVRRGRGRERAPDFPTERVPYGGVSNQLLQRVTGKGRPRSRSKGRVRERLSDDASASKGAKHGLFNVISLPTDAQSTGTSSQTPREPTRVDKGKQRAIEANPSTENLPAHRKSLESLDLQTSKGSGGSTFFSNLFGNSSPAGPSNAGPSNTAPSRPPRDVSLARRPSSSSTAIIEPQTLLQQARENLLKCMIDPEYLKRSRVTLKNYPFSKEAAEVYSEVQKQRRLLEKTRILLKDAVEKNDVLRRENSNISKSWEQNVEQLQMALENEIEEKDGILAEAERRRKNVSNASTQTVVSKGTQQTETNIVANILAKHKDRLAAAQSSTSYGRATGPGTQVDWSRLAPRSWGTQSSRMRRLLHAHAEDSDGGGRGDGGNNDDGNDDGNQQDTSDETPSGILRLPLFTFEMHGQHEDTCEEEEERIKTRKEAKGPD